MNPSTEVAVRSGEDTRMVSVLPYAYWRLNERMRYADTLAKAGDLIPSGLYDKATGKPSPAKVFLVLETGAMLGLHPMGALAGIDVIEGKATISPRLFTGLVRGAGHKLRIEETGSIGGGDFRVSVTLIRSDDPDYPLTASWDMDDTVQAGLVDSYEPDQRTGRWTVKARSRNGNPLNWEKFPKDMCQWRALGRLARKGAADVLMGIGYFPEELEVAVDEEGERVDRTADESDLIAEFKAFDDKADMAAIFQRHHTKVAPDTWEASEVWTPRVQAEFDAHLSTLTKDSRPPKPGTPGQTGIAAIDAPAEEAQNEAAPPASQDVETIAPENPSEDSEAADEPAAADGEMTAEEYEAWSREQYEKAAAEQAPAEAE